MVAPIFRTMKAILKLILKLLARATLRRYRPRVVGITGSVGKTATKAAVAGVLGTRFRLNPGYKNLNNEFGLPLCILGEADSGYGSAWAWLGILGRGLRQLLFHNPHYPEVLVLEYGIDRPGDMVYLLNLARPQVAVVTAIGPTHLEFLKTLATVAAEKARLVQALTPAGLAVLNADDPQVMALAPRLRARVVTFGFGEGANVQAEAVASTTNQAGTATGTTFKLRLSGSSLPVSLQGLCGRPPVLASLAAAAVGQEFGVPLIDIANALQGLVWPAGRLRLVPGSSETTLIDDTYNSSPRAVAEALQILRELPRAPGTRRWAILGDMLELGQQSKDLHREAGRLVASGGVDYLVTVGRESVATNEAARAAGFNGANQWHYATSGEVGSFVKPRLHPGDVVLIKGSQGVRCERITRELMREPARAGELLVRQHKPWV